MPLALDRLSTAGLDARAVRLALLVGATLNGLTVHIAKAWGQNTGASVFLGVSPFELIAALIATMMVWQAGRAELVPPRLGWPDALAGLALLVPSSSVAWLTLALYAGWLGWRSQGREAGALMFMGLALVELWSSVGLKLVAMPVTTAEAALVARSLALVADGVVQSGNVVGITNNHVLVIMTACSSLDGIPKAILGLFAVSILAGTLSRERWIIDAALLASIYALANLVRLTVMASSSEAYALAHGPIGSNLFDLTTTLALFAIALPERRA